MCGIFGVINSDNIPINVQTVARATQTLRHRGPDDEGYLLMDIQTGGFESTSWNNPGLEQRIRTNYQEWNTEYKLAFGFRRLSILDLTMAGHQPMSSQDNLLWIVYNGEIYNYIELREELKQFGYLFQTNTDTEVILCAYHKWGEACLKRFNGMWSFAIWDQRKSNLFCARDRFGIKPFYYLFDNAEFVFASEIKAFLSIPGIKKIPNNDLIYDYLSANLLDHTADTFFNGIKQIPPAHYLILHDGQIKLHRYWDINQNNSSINILNEEQVLDDFYHLFEDSIRLHLRSDVPIGSCLSGGLDSSAIVCLINKLLFSKKIPNPDIVGERQKTFSSCFEDPRFDERIFIEKVLAATGAEKNYVFPDVNQLQKDLNQLIWHQDEPFGSLSIYAQWCVMRLISTRGVKVTIDGQGGDEILAGYHNCFDYYWNMLAKKMYWSKLWREWNDYQIAYSVPISTIIARTLRPDIPQIFVRQARHKKRSGGFGSQTLGIHPDFARNYRNRNMEVISTTPDPFQGYLYSLLTNQSIPKLLHYEDRNSMAHSVEARVPFLDHRLVEYVFSIPSDLKINHGVTKVALRNSLKNILPESIRTRRDKMGFVTPERAWISQELRSLFVDIFTSGSFRDRGYFNITEIQKSFDNHLRGNVDLTSLAWRWVNLECWFRLMIDNRSVI